MLIFSGLDTYGETVIFEYYIGLINPGEELEYEFTYVTYDSDSTSTIDII